MGGIIAEIGYYCLIVLIDVFYIRLFFDMITTADKSKGKKWLLLLLLGFLTLVFSLFLNGNYWLKESLMLCTIAIIMKFYEDISFARGLVFTLFFLGIMLLSECITLLIRAYFFPELDLADMAPGLLVSLLSRAIAIFAILLVGVIFRKKKWSVLEDRDWLMVLFFPIFTVCIIVMMLSNELYLIDARRVNLYLMIAIGLILMNIIVFYLLNEIAKRAQEIQDNKLFEQETRNILKLYENLSENVERQRELSHDFYRQLCVIRELNESGHKEELDAYLSDFNESGIKRPDCINTNHVIVNAVLNEKYRIAMEHQILFTMESNDLSALSMQQQDIAMLLSNLLDNAIEACMQCEEKKEMILKIVLREEELIVAVKNTYSGERKMKNGTYITTKENPEYHGQGLKNIARIIKAYGGDYAITTENSAFYISICIPEMKKVG